MIDPLGPKISNIFKSIGDSNEAKIRIAEYSTILFQQGQFLSRVRPTKFKANMIAKIERTIYVGFTFDSRSIRVRFSLDSGSIPVQFD